MSKTHIMIEPKPVIQFLTIILALAGAYLVAEIAYNEKKGGDGHLIRARAFLNDSFLHDSQKLLFFACFIFLINAVLELNDMFGVFMKVNNPEFLQEMILLGVLTCTVISEYKWLKLIKPKR